jgi:hypothetical protein
VRFPPQAYLGIIGIQLNDHPELIPLLMKRFVDYLKANPDMAHYQGKLFVVEVHRIRVRE